MLPPGRLLPLLTLAAGALGLQGWQEEEEVPPAEEAWDEWAPQLDYYSDQPAAGPGQEHGVSGFLEDYGEYQEITADEGTEAQVLGQEENAWLTNSEVSEGDGKEEDDDIEVEYFMYDEEHEAGNNAENDEHDEEQNKFKQQNFMKTPGSDISLKSWFNFLSKPSKEKPSTGESSSQAKPTSDMTRPHKNIVLSKGKVQSIVGEKLETTSPPGNKKQAATGDNRNGFNIFSTVVLQDLYSIPRTMARARRRGRGQVLGRVASFINVLTDFAVSYNQLSGALVEPS